jgi:hypothetical protein
MAHLTGKHKLEHTVAETLYFKPHQKYFRENAYFSRSFLTSELMATFVLLISLNKVMYKNVHITL